MSTSAGAHANTARSSPLAAYPEILFGRTCKHRTSLMCPHGVSRHIITSSVHTHHRLVALVCFCVTLAV